MNKIIAVVGPTASGKTSLSIALAERFDGEIISADSMQLYRHMNIGTAKPDEEEKHGIRHHLLDILDISEAFSVSDYCSVCKEAAADIVSRGKLPILCGGTGFYVDSFLGGISFGEFDHLPEFREEMNKVLAESGVDVLYERLCKVDPDNKVDRHNPKRVIRALEVYEATGKTLAQWNELSRQKGPEYDSLIIGLNFADREKLYERIDLRVDEMMKNGLLSEVETLIGMGLPDAPTASQAIGYKEFYPYFAGEAELSDCVEKLKRESRRYAKRQMTWFKRNPAIRWIFPDECTDIKETAFALVEDFLSGNSIPFNDNRKDVKD